MIELIMNIIVPALIALCFWLDACSATRALERRVKRKTNRSKQDKSWLGDDSSSRRRQRRPLGDKGD